MCIRDRAEAVKGIKTKDVISFIWKNVITRFGVPMSMVFDNGPQFETPVLKSWLGTKELHTTLHLSVVHKQTAR